MALPVQGAASAAAAAYEDRALAERLARGPACAKPTQIVIVVTVFIVIVLIVIVFVIIIIVFG